MRRLRAAAAMAASVAAASCATTRPPAATASPDLSTPPGAPAPAHAALYAACLSEATAARRFDLSADPTTQLLRFTCRGPAAEAFYAALGPWSAAERSGWRREGRSYRSTARVRRDLFGVDYCSAADTGGDAQCVVTLNAGRFLTAP